MVSRILSTYDEAEAFHWLGAAVVSLWTTLTAEAQEAIVQRALAMSHGDISAGEQIKAYTHRRNGKPDATTQ
jgi:hypothetical protein